MEPGLYYSEVPWEITWHSVLTSSCSSVADAGMDDGNSPFTSIKDALKDSKRIKYHNDYLTNLAASIKYPKN